MCFVAKRVKLLWTLHFLLLCGNPDESCKEKKTSPYTNSETQIDDNYKKVFSFKLLSRHTKIKSAKLEEPKNKF